MEMELVEQKKLVYIVEFDEIGIEGAFHTFEAAKSYILKAYTKGIVDMFNPHCNDTVSILEQIQEDLELLETEGYIENYAYIYSVEYLD